MSSPQRLEREAKYSRTSMARTSLGPLKFVRDMGSCGLTMAPGQEVNGDDLGNSFQFSI